MNNRFVDYFPTTGLVAQFKPDILTEVKKYCAKYPRVPFLKMLLWAIKIATDLEPHFDSARAKSFSTPLRHHLKRLNRLAQQYIKQLKTLEAAASQFISLEDINVDGPPKRTLWGCVPHTERDATSWRRSVWLPSAGDGTNLIFDLQRVEQTTDLFSGSLAGSLTPVIHYRLTICMEAPPSEDPIAFQDRVSRVLTALNSSEPYQSASQ